MSMVSILRTIVFCWISCWNIALNSLRNVGRDMGSSTLGEAREDKRLWVERYPVLTNQLDVPNQD